MLGVDDGFPADRLGEVDSLDSCRPVDNAVGWSKGGEPMADESLDDVYEEQMTLNPGESKSLDVFDRSGKPLHYEVIANPCPPHASAAGGQTSNDSSKASRDDDVVIPVENPHTFAEVIAGLPRGRVHVRRDGLHFATDEDFDPTHFANMFDGTRARLMQVESESILRTGLGRRAIVVLLDELD